MHVPHGLWYVWGESLPLPFLLLHPFLPPSLHFSFCHRALTAVGLQDDDKDLDHRLREPV